MPDLETVDLLGVEILSTGGPVFGQGSPPEGDFWTADDLRAMAAADAELGDEINPPGKIGHSDAQKLLGLTDGEMPAVGWLENVRYDDTSQKLVGDFLKVPKKFAELVEAGAYRTRSVELSRVTSQTTQKVYDWVVTGVAWLGGKLPAVKTLDDVMALYEERNLELEARRYVVYEQPPDGTPVWDPDAGVQDLLDDLEDTLNGPTMYGAPSRYWVCDVILDTLTSGRALVKDSLTDYDDAWIVPFAIGDDLEPTPANPSEWIKADQTWVATSEVAYEARIRRFSGRSRGRADTRPEMPKVYTDEQRSTFAEATGLEAENVTDEMLEAAGVADATEPAKPAPVKPERDNEGDDLVRKLAEDLEEQKRELAEERETARLDRRRSFVEGLMTEGKIEPGKREKWERAFDKDEENARELASDLEPNEELGREFGSDDENLTDEQKRELAEADEREYEEYASRVYGLSKEAIV